MNRSLYSPYRLAALSTLLSGALAGAVWAQPTGGATQPLSPALGQSAPMSHGAGMSHHGHGGMHHEGGMHRARMLKQIDSDGDGQISRAEMDVAHEAMRTRSVTAFEAADANRDGKLSQDEMRAYHQAMRASGASQGARGSRPDAGAPARSANPGS